MPLLAPYPRPGWPAVTTMTATTSDRTLTAQPEPRTLTATPQPRTMEAVHD